MRQPFQAGWESRKGKTQDLGREIGPGSSLCWDIGRLLCKASEGLKASACSSSIRPKLGGLDRLWISHADWIMVIGRILILGKQAKSLHPHKYMKIINTKQNMKTKLSPSFPSSSTPSMSVVFSANNSITEDSVCMASGSGPGLWRYISSETHSGLAYFIRRFSGRVWVRDKLKTRKNWGEWKGRRHKEKWREAMEMCAARLTPLQGHGLGTWG